MSRNRIGFVLSIEFDPDEKVLERKLLRPMEWPSA